MSRKFAFRSPEDVMSDYKTEVTLLSVALGGDFVCLLATLLSLNSDNTTKIVLGILTGAVAFVAHGQHGALAKSEQTLLEYIKEERINLRRQPEYFLHIAEKLASNVELKKFFSNARSNKQ